METQSRLKTDLFCLIVDTTKTQLSKDAGLQVTDLYQYQLKGCLCSILIQGHWIVEHSCMLVPIINEVLHFGCISEEKITLDCSGTFPSTLYYSRHKFLCILLTSKKKYFKIPSSYCLSVIEFTVYESLHLFSSELNNLPQIMSSTTTKEQNWHLESCNICWCSTLLAPFLNYSIIQVKREKKKLSHIQLGKHCSFFLSSLM